jgi:hypothetical protein
MEEVMHVMILRCATNSSLGRLMLYIDVIRVVHFVSREGVVCRNFERGRFLGTT